MICERAVVVIVAGMLFAVSAAGRQQPADPIAGWTLLWPGGAPGALGSGDADRPAVAIFLAPKEKAAGTGIVVCPGGAYGHLAVDHEGKQIAGFLNSLGISAFVLRYRVAPKYRHPAPITDAQRALRLVRFRAAEFGIAANRIGIWGFSAGGHLASTAGTHFDAGDPNAPDPIDRESCRPDFMVLAYPVIQLNSEYTHRGSRDNLLGKEPDTRLVASLSTETQVTSQTPPTFLFHTNEDKGVPAENSIAFYLALRKAAVPAELHIYERGNHGVGLAAKDPILATWTGRLADWLKTRGLLK